MEKDIFLVTHVVQVEQVDSKRREVMDFNMLTKNIINFLIFLIKTLSLSEHSFMVKSWGVVWWWSVVVVVAHEFILS